MWQHYLEAVQFLLVRGSDVNARDDCGYSALHLSAEHGYMDIMSLLIEYQVGIALPLSYTIPFKLLNQSTVSIRS